MVAIVPLLLMVLRPALPDPFLVQAELQGLYDEMGQATLQFKTANDVDDFHTALYTPDWTFADTAGHKQVWDERRTLEIDALSKPKPDSIRLSIVKITLVPGGATVVVQLASGRTVVDDTGRYGPQGRSHLITEVTTFRDDWIVGADAHWKVKSRQQLGDPKTLVDKPAPTR
jgi:hypothetical protein